MLIQFIVGACVMSRPAPANIPVPHSSPVESSQTTDIYNSDIDIHSLFNTEMDVNKELDHITHNSPINMALLTNYETLSVLL